MFSLIPSSPPERAVRLRRQLMAIYSYGFLWLGTIMGVELAAFDPGTPHFTIFGCALLINGLFFALIRAGIGQHFKDPSFTFVQMAIGIALTTVLLHYTRELRGAMLSIYFMVMTFGIFSLGRRRMILLAGYAVLCFTLLLIYEWIETPQQAIFVYLIGHWMILLLGMSWFIYMGGYIHNLQQRVRQQREDLRQAHDRLSAIAIRDELTGLYNRRYFLQRLEEEMSLANRDHSTLLLAIIDLDHFKQVNDNYGHQAGDEVLRAFAQVANQSLRKSDLLARYGGEEFVVLFPHSQQDFSLAGLNRLSERFQQQHFEFAPQLTTSFSAGLAAYQQGDSAKDLIKRADAALYQAKAQGRNRIIHDSGGTVERLKR